MSTAHGSSTGAVDDGDLVDQVCRRVADLPGDADELVRRCVGGVAPLLHGDRRERLVRAAVARLTGLGQLDAYLADPEIDEILVNRGREIWIEVGGHVRRAGTIDTEALGVILERVLAPLGRRLDRSDPIVDARLPDGSRVCAVVPPIAVDGPTLAIRRFRHRALGLDAFCSPDVGALLARLVDLRCNLVVSGATSSGKTSLLTALLGRVPDHERIVVLEDTTELRISAPNVVRLEARGATPDGPPPIPLDELLRAALRLRPDRLVVGEIRGAEVLALVHSMNTGHDGCLSTCHANGPVDAIARLETLVLQAAPTWPLVAIRAQLTRSVDAIVHVARGATSARHVAEVVEVVADDGPPRVRSLTRGTEVIGEPTRSRS